MKIELITPAAANARNGNRGTAVRWAAMLRQLGHRVNVTQSYEGGLCDLMIALHARRSFDSIHRFHQAYPELPLIVVLTGTDLYRDIRNNPKAQKSLEMATRLIVLQSMGIRELPLRFRAKTRVIYQSAPRFKECAQPPAKGFKVCVIGHLRSEKDPMRTAIASHLLPPSSKISVVHIGRALAEPLKKRASAEAARNPRYHWLGDLPHWRTMRILSRAHLLSITSRMEGSSNVLCEAIALSVPVIASRISGLVGTLGENYPGYFPVGNARKLADLLQRAESNAEFYLDLKKSCARPRPLLDPERELACLEKLLGELS